MNLKRIRNSPNITVLNPRVTTTDSLHVNYGNPYLKPSISNTCELSYSLNLKSLFLTPRMGFTYNQDNVIPVGEMDGAIYRSTYTNGDHSRFVNTGLTIGIRLGQIGNINVTPYWQKVTYNESKSFNGKSWGINTNVYLSYRKVYFNGYMYYTQYGYTRTSRYSYSPMIDMIFAWNLPKGWTLSVGLRDNVKSSKNWLYDGNYTAFNRSYTKDWSWTPMLGFSYNFRSKSQLRQREKRYKNGSDSDNFNIIVK